MADTRTFVLVGNFTDNITPALDKINNSLNGLKRNLSGFGVKRGGFDDLTKSMGKVTGAHMRLNQQVKELRSELTQNLSVLREYRKEVDKAVSAKYYTSRLGSRAAKEEAKFWQQATQSAINYNKTVASLGGRATARTRPSGGRVVPPGFEAPTRGGGYGAAVAGGVLGNQLSGVMTSAIVQGFQIGTSLMMKPFQYFQQALGERINDEMSDLRAAGGYFAIAKRQKDPFVTTMDEAIQYTQKNNQVLAKLASALPGSTQDYIEVSKRLSDTITRVVSKDLTGAIKEANRLRSTPEGMKFYGEQITGTGRKATQEAITTLLADMTKRTVLAGFGGRAGAGGAMGPYGLPGLTERLISQENVSVAQFQRYAAIFSDPQILDALTRNIDKVNATGKDSIERYKALQQLYDEILPPELVEKFRRSVKGINEALYSAALNPEVGFLGIGRKMEGLGRQMNDFGQYVDETGTVVSDVNKAAKVNLSLYELLRDIYAQTAQVLVPIVEYLPELWDPLKNIGKVLSDARHYTGQFLQSFNAYRDGLKNYAKTLGPANQLKIMESLDIRASMLAISNLFKQLGVIGGKEFADLSRQIVDPNVKIPEVLKKLIDTFFSSEAAAELGRFLGNLIGTTLRQVADATKYISGVVEGGGFAGGFASAFEKSGGFSAIQDIFMSIVQMFVKAIGAAVLKMPLLSATIAALALLPTIIGAAVTNMVERCMGGVMGGACPMPGGGGGAARRKRGFFSAPYNEGRRQRFMKPYVQGARTIGAFGADAASSALGMQPGRALIRQRNFLGSAARMGAKASRMIPGGALAGGAIDVGLALASGENFGKAATGAIGTALGGVVGSAFGPVGTMIGMAAGGIIGDATADAIAKITAKGPSVEQLHAAEMQNEAAVKQLQAAKLQAGGLEPDKATYTFGTAQQFADRLKVLGLESDKAAVALKSLYGRRESAATAAKTAADELNSKIKQLRDQGKIPPDLIAKQVRPLQEQFNQAKKNLAASQAAFDAQFRKTPEIIQRSITNSLGALSFKSIETILGNKLAGIQVTPPRNPLTTANSYLDTQPTVSIPTFGNNISGGLFDRTRGAFYKGGLGDAVRSELKNKPSNSDLVIANSSETIIPAAGGSAGSGMLDFVRTLQSGFSAVVRAVTEAKRSQDATLAKINQTLVTNQQQTNTRLAKLETKFSTPMGGLGGGSVGGGVDAFTPIAQRYGLQMTSGYRPGDPGWHGANRARDYSNSTGPTAQMMQFAQYLASTYGSNLKELIYTPLGFSIKNGQRVAPYAQGSHYNHVHVAYGLGAGNPAFFSSAGAADRWETAMARREPIISSVRATASEVGGGNYTINAPITINQQPGQDPDTLASLVVMKLSMAIDEIRNHTA